MIEDKLSSEERLRLESVSQAVQIEAIRAHVTGSPASPEQVLETAARLESFIRGEGDDR